MVELGRFISSSLREVEFGIWNSSALDACPATLFGKKRLAIASTLVWAGGDWWTLFQSFNPKQACEHLARNELLRNFSSPYPFGSAEGSGLDARKHSCTPLAGCGAQHLGDRSTCRQC